MKCGIALLALLGAAAQAAAGPIVLTGATGHTGWFIFKLLKAHGHDVRAFVRNATKAKQLLNCSKCDESEGVFEGDIKDINSMKSVMAGASALMIATSATPVNPTPPAIFHKGATPIDIDWNGARNQLTAFAERTGVDSSQGHVALISTGGTETPEDPTSPTFMDYIRFYKLNFEAELMASGLPFTIIKPCRLDFGVPTEPGMRELVTGHDGSINMTVNWAIARADVARMMVAAIEGPNISQGLRFDLCSQPGTTTDADLGKVLQGAKLPWQQPKAIVV